jgi:Mor family transcriptional regulator
MLKENLLDGRTYEWIAEKYDLSVRQVARIIPKIKKKLFEKL